MLKNRTARPQDRIFSLTALTWARAERRSKWTPKIFSPDLASSRLVASPNPLDEPIIRAHGVTPVLSVMCAAPFPSLRSRAGGRRPFERRFGGLDSQDDPV